MAAWSCHQSREATAASAESAACRRRSSDSLASSRARTSCSSGSPAPSRSAEDSRACNSRVSRLVAASAEGGRERRRCLLPTQPSVSGPLQAVVGALARPHMAVAARAESGDAGASSESSGSQLPAVAAQAGKPGSASPLPSVAQVLRVEHVSLATVASAARPALEHQGSAAAWGCCSSVSAASGTASGRMPCGATPRCA
mmetsp:Transcript_57749/g.185613  ORF Transcript_57749/g.185613 Transcript_57749/m.185613 type:complete len:200 (-) Transcript_57749:167-766(-)